MTFPLCIRCCCLCTSVLVGADLQGHVAANDISPFTEEAVARGLIYEIRPRQTITIGGDVGGGGFGIAVADLNGNGCLDITVLGAPDERVGLFENDCAGFFTDRSFTLNMHRMAVPKFKLTKSSGIAVADYNGDGMLDIYLTQHMNAQPHITYPSMLLRNDGNFNFTNVAAQAGVTNMGNGEGASWGDFDNDGWLDLYVSNYTLPEYQGIPVHRNKLYRNLGGNGATPVTFEDVSAAQGVDDHGAGFIAAFADINRNGWLDLYLANDKGQAHNFPANQLWVNNPDGSGYTNACATSGSACLGLWAMCVAAGDFDGNGYPDFYVTNIAHPAGYNGWNPLIMNNGDETFTENCQGAGVCNLVTSWCGIFFDYSNNGWLDLYVCNQFPANNLFAMNGVFPATKITELAGVGGNAGDSFNASVGDLTGNGAMDLVLNNGAPVNTAPINVELFINHEGIKRNWIRFTIVGYDGNVHAIGGNVEVTANGRTQWREVYAGGNNYKAQNELVWHFGLDDAAIADQIVVNWPGLRGSRTLSNYPANHRWTIWPAELLGDVNNDGVINGFDLLAMLSAWGILAPGHERLDMNGDGEINGFDLLNLLSKWGAL